MIRTIRHLLARTLRQLCALVLLAMLATSANAEDDHTLIFAASSLRPALSELLESEPESEFRVSYAASSQLARQIEHGAPASVFISADTDWMSHLESLGLLAPGTRTDVLGNVLVLITQADNPAQIDLADDTDLLAALGESARIAIAEPVSVPAGRYAKQALVSLGVWHDIEKRAIHAADVRAALNFVARKEAVLGIVYRSDAVSEPRVRVSATFAATTHAPITYQAAVLRTGDSPQARRFLALLTSTTAREIFKRHGFEIDIATTGERAD